VHCFRVIVTLFAAWAASSVNAEVYYVAVDGKAENNGSQERPWPSAEYALGQVGGGQTIVLKPGIYRGPLKISRQFAGTPDRPTVIKAETKWKAVVVGSESHVVSTADDCNWVIIDGLEVMGGRYDGVKISGDHGVVRNCWIHNNMAMGVAMHGRQGGTIENNLIEFNGTHIQFDHGVYADGEGLTVRGNVVRHNACFGLQLYPSIANARVYNNLIYGQVRRRGIVVSCPTGGGKNYLVNNTVVEDEPITIANGNGEVLQNNILISQRGEAISVDANTRDILADYNLCQPKSDRQGPHGLSGDPQFVAPEHGVFWLRDDSPAVGRGAGQYAPATDFWGRRRSPDQAVDLGAFAFERSLLGTQVRADWDHGWAYHRHGNKIGLPDLWALPQSEASGAEHSPK
jgi:hypothetical protein